MVNLLRRILGRNKQSKTAIEVFVEKGIAQVGQGCDVKTADIIVVNQKAGHCQLVIGDNVCMRNVMIILYTETAMVNIGSNVYIGPGTVIECTESISIGSNVLVSSNCSIIDTNSHSINHMERRHDVQDWKVGLHAKDWTVVGHKPIVIDDDVWLGLRSIVMKGVNLAKGTIVAAGAVVTKSTEDFDIIGGNPAKVIGKAS